MDFDIEESYFIISSFVDNYLDLIMVSKVHKIIMHQEVV